MHMPRNDRYKGIIHYKLRVVFDLEPLSLPHWGQYIVSGMKYSSVPWWGPDPHIPSVLGVVWLKSDCRKQHCQCQQQGGTGSQDPALPTSLPWGSLDILQVKQLWWVSVSAMDTFAVNAMKHKKKTWGEGNTLGWFFGLMSLANTSQWVWKPQGNDEGQPHRVVFLPLWYLSNIRRAKVHIEIFPQHFLGVLCCPKFHVRDKSTCYVFLSEAVSDLNTAHGQYRRLGTSAFKTWPLKRPFLEKFHQTGWMQSGTCCICPVQCTCNMAIPMVLAALKETELSCFLLELKFGILLRRLDFLCRNRIYIDTMNHA